MEKQTTVTKIILGLIIFAFLVSLSPFATPAHAATSSSMSNVYANPNQDNGKNPYKFKISNVVNSQLLTSVVGCTGVVSKVSTWMAKFITSPVQTAKKAAETIANFIKQLKKACTAVKAGVEGVVGATPFVNDEVTTVNTVLSMIEAGVGTGADMGGVTELDMSGYQNNGTAAASPSTPTTSSKEKVCQDKVDATDKNTLMELQKQTEQQAETKIVDQCLNGIAITLAKNQLTAMTRSMMNWVNSGLGGNPFFVQNMRNFTTKLENNVIETGIDALLAPGVENPYARDFARSTIATRGIVSSSAKFLGGLQSDLEAFVTDPQSYYTDATMGDAAQTQLALQRARGANNAFANDFATGGWNAWLALTQRDNNNPLGYSMLANQYLAEMETQQVTEKKDELAQNNGFMSQKTCIKWQVYTKEGKVEYKSGSGGIQANGLAKSFVLNQKTVPPGGAWTCYKDGGNGDCCIDWKVTTPGSLIAEKTKSYLTSDTRQLELAKTINDVLNGLFSALLSKLEGGGLIGLSDSSENISNWTDNMNDLSDISADGSSTYDNNGAYDGFNITRDLGNTYIHDTYTSLGNWNADTNVPGLSPNNPPIVAEGTSAANTYYTVNNGVDSATGTAIVGTTKLIDAGNNNWENGDRVFWDGTAWQNWKCGTNAQGACSNQTNPIKTRGVLQTQEDYVLAVKDILKVLPGIMPKLGKLDYCLPGPNPSYKANSTDAQGAYQDWVGSASVGTIDSSGNRFGPKIDDAGSRTYDNLHNIYYENPGVWTKILDSMQFLLYAFSHICDAGESSLSECGSYFYGGLDNFYRRQHFDAKQAVQEVNLDYTDNHIFQNFYEVFDRMMNRIYFNNITQKYLLHEDRDLILPPTIPNDLNPDYVPMAQEGYDLTKDIVTYATDTQQSILDYTNSMKQAQINVAKLQPIKDEVGAIIKDAQDARNARMLTQINLLNTQTLANCQTAFDQCLIQYGLPLGTMPTNGQGVICLGQQQLCLTNVNTGLLTETAFNTKYASCIAEENIQVFDADSMTTSETGNCSDSIDNDFDGLVDLKDPDCNGALKPNGGSNLLPASYTAYFKLTSDCTSTPPSIVDGWTGPIHMGGPGALPIISYGDLMESGTDNYYRVIGTNIVQDPTDGTATNITNTYNDPTLNNPALTELPGVTLEPSRQCPNGWIWGTGSGGTTTQTYTVTINVVGTGGTVQPSSRTGISSGGGTFFEVTPDTGKTAAFGGNCGAVTSTQAGSQYQVTNILADCTVNVSFN